MSHNAGDRKWLRQTIRINGQSVGRHIIRCSECSAEHEILDRGYRQLPFDEVERRMVRDKWFVGKNEKHDLCPACVRKKQDERRARRAARPKPELTIVSSAPAPASPSSAQQHIQESAPMTTTMPDRPINRDDKRLINLKLHEVYIDEKSGYYAPHTDHSVAKDLGVPVSWVREIREEMFGPAHSNSDIDDHLAKIEAAKTEALKIIAEANAAINDLKAIVVKLPPLSDRINTITRTVEGLSRVSEVIRKAVS